MKEIISSKSISKELPAAYTERFNLGNLKGKSPAEVLNENSNGRDLLIEQGNFLNKNAEKFPANKKMIAAIKEALQLQKEGKLEKQTEGPANIITIYDENLKILRSQKRDNGKLMVYGINIVCNTSRNLPFSIEISNCFAPVDIADNGKMNAKMKEAEDIKKISMNMTEKDWFKIISRMKKNLNNFETIHFRDLNKIAEEAEKENRLNAMGTTA